MSAGATAPDTIIAVVSSMSGMTLVRKTSTARKRVAVTAKIKKRLAHLRSSDFFSKMHASEVIFFPYQLCGFFPMKEESFKHKSRHVAKNGSRHPLKT